MTVAWPAAGSAAQESSRAGLSPLARDDSDASMDFYDQLGSLDSEPRHAAVRVADELGSGDLQALIAGGAVPTEAGPLTDDELVQWINNHPIVDDWWWHPQQAPAAGGTAAAAAVPDLDPVLLRWRSDDYQVDVLPADFQPLLSDTLTGAVDSAPPPRVLLLSGPAALQETPHGAVCAHSKC